MGIFKDMINWIVDLSERDSSYQTRFSLSPSATHREGVRNTDEENQQSANQPSTNQQPTNQQPTNQQSTNQQSTIQRNRPPKRVNQAVSISDLKRMSVLQRRAMKVGEEQGTQDNIMKHLDDDVERHYLPLTFSDQVEYLQRLLHYPRNADIQFVTHTTAAHQKVVTIYSQVAIDPKEFEDFILTIIVNTDDTIKDMKDLAELLPARQYSIQDDVLKLATSVIEGNVVILMGMAQALVCSFSRFKMRAISTPINETVIRGSQEAFTEGIESNMSQLRRILRCPDLVMEMITLQDMARTRVCICSMAHVTNPRLLAEMHRRITNIGPIPHVAPGLVEQHIEDHSRSIFPTIIYTERPDLTSRYIAQGQVALFIDNLPLVLVAPSTFWMQLATAEDANLRPWYANFLRSIRLLALVVALVLPGLYVGLTNFQQEMIPSDLLLAMTVARQNLPFPTVVEVLILEVAFELIREASIRVPHVIGSTIGIVGALILGQSAVDANLVSPVVVIVVALTGMGSFAIPNQSIGFAFRILRYSYTVISFLLGFFGIAVLFSIMIVYMSSMQSFGVPYLTPIAPLRSKEEGFLRKSVLAYSTRPASFRSLPTENLEVQEKDDMGGNSNDAQPDTGAKNSSQVINPSHIDSSNDVNTQSASTESTSTPNAQVTQNTPVTAGEQPTADTTAPLTEVPHITAHQETINHDIVPDSADQADQAVGKPWRKPRPWRSKTKGRPR